MLDKLLFGVSGYYLGKSRGQQEEDSFDKENSLEHRVACLTTELELLEDFKELFTMFLNGQIDAEEIDRKITSQLSITKQQCKRFENQLRTNRKNREE